jgi:hypothetical protein
MEFYVTITIYFKLIKIITLNYEITTIIPPSPQWKTHLENSDIKPVTILHETSLYYVYQLNIESF